MKLKPHEEPLRSELLSGKFTILVSIVRLIGFCNPESHTTVDRKLGGVVFFKGYHESCRMISGEIMQTNASVGPS